MEGAYQHAAELRKTLFPSEANVMSWNKKISKIARNFSLGQNQPNTVVINQQKGTESAPKKSTCNKTMPFVSSGTYPKFTLDT